MNRKNFALSWGRKLFFGISWPLSSVLSILYLRSFILPETSTDWIYFATTLIGHIGLLNVIFYFILYCPIVMLLPSYYISRFWSSILILTLNLFVLVDALSYSSYHLHIYSYLFRLISEDGVHHVFGSNAGLIVLGSGMLLLAILLWVRGEMTWRYMQTRFSNPVKNWYIVLIFISLIASKLLYHYSNIHPSLAQLFPLNFNLPRTEKAFQNKKRFYYPKDNLACQGKQNPNIVLLTVREWSHEDFNEESMPKIFHMQRHAMNFHNHQTVSLNTGTGLYTLLYSLPFSYDVSTPESEKPVIIKEIESRQYEYVHMNENIQLKFKDWIEERPADEIAPYFLSLLLDQSVADNEIQNIILQLQRKDFLRNTHIIITGAHSSTQKTPLMWITPERKNLDNNHLTTHYDVMPSLLQKIWSCKKAFKAASVGEPLELKGRDWYIKSTQSGFEIVDVAKNGIISVEDGSINTTGGGRRELIFPALKLLTRFNRPD